MAADLPPTTIGPSLLPKTGIIEDAQWGIDLHSNAFRAQAGTVNTGSSLVIGQLGVVGSVANCGASDYLPKVGSSPLVLPYTACGNSGPALPYLTTCQETPKLECLHEISQFLKHSADQTKYVCIAGFPLKFLPEYKHRPHTICLNVYTLSIKLTKYVKYV